MDNETKAVELTLTVEIPKDEDSETFKNRLQRVLSENFGKGSSVNVDMCEEEFMLSERHKPSLSANVKEASEELEAKIFSEMEKIPDAELSPLDQLRGEKGKLDKKWEKAYIRLSERGELE